jgi:hypothetical protein
MPYHIEDADRPRVLERFWLQVVKTDGCWLWTGAIDSNGYGKFALPRPWRRVAAHRVSFALHNGELEPGKFVCHACDNPPCVRPDHLFLGTQSDNMRDMLRKGRGRNPLFAKLAARTHCALGHEYSPENTRINCRGQRRCVQCERRWSRQGWARRQARLMAQRAETQSGGGA